MSGSPALPDLVAYIEAAIPISTRNYGPGSRLVGVIKHIEKELIEVQLSPQDPFEWADLIILAIDGAWREGIAPEALTAALVAKQAINSRRRWPDWRTASPDEPIEHDRSGDG